MFTDQGGRPLDTEYEPRSAEEWRRRAAASARRSQDRRQRATRTSNRIFWIGVLIGVLVLISLLMVTAR